MNLQAKLLGASIDLIIDVNDDWNISGKNTFKLGIPARNIFAPRSVLVGLKKNL